MGFMDKAKKLAEQAQQKLDEAQNQFNQGGSTQPQGQGGGVRYDSHGRPIEQPPAADTPPPAAEPTAPADPTSGFPAAPTAADPVVPPDPSAEQEQPPSEEPPPAPSGGANASPDPFKPLQ